MRMFQHIITLHMWLPHFVHTQLIEHELEGFGIRLNKKPPNITFKKKDKGGINFTTSVQVSNLSRLPCTMHGMPYTTHLDMNLCVTNKKSLVGRLKRQFCMSNKLKRRK